MISNTLDGMSNDQDQAVSNEVMNDRGVMKCNFTKDGFCNTHGWKASKLSIPTKKWAAKRGGGFGWKTVRVTRFLCKARNDVPAEPEISTSVISSNSQERFRDFSGSIENNGLGDLPAAFEERKSGD